MSYCRWSSMNWRCDVYVYADVSGGWTTHVAGRRRAWPIVPEFPFDWYPSFGRIDMQTRELVYPSRFHALASWTMFRIGSLWNLLNRWSLDLSPLRAIGGEHDGASFSDGEPGSCADRLELLRAAGYIVPQYAIDALREDQAELTVDPAQMDLVL